MSIAPTRVELGAFAQGEIPPPIQHTFTDFLDQPVDLTGFGRLETNIKEELDSNANPLGVGATTVVAPATLGVVQYQWTADDMADLGDYEVQIRVWDEALKRYASDLFIYSVYDGPETAPV